MDLSGIDWGGNREEGTVRLAALEVEVDPDRRRAVVIHDAHHELPVLWNWLIGGAGNRKQDGGEP